MIGQPVKIQELVNRVHVACPESFLRDAESLVSSAQGSAFKLDLDGVRTAAEIVSRAIDVFRIPWPIVGIDSLISVGSELYWIESARRFLVIIDNFADMPSDALDSLATSVMNIVDRMRTAGDEYIAAFTTSAKTDELLTLLAKENARLARLEHHPWVEDTHPVPVVDHRLDAAAEN